MNSLLLNVACILLISLIPVLISAELPIESLDTPYLSELRFKFRHEEKLVQCAKYWKGMDEKLKNVKPVYGDSTNNVENLLDIVNVDLLMRVSSVLKSRAAGGRSLAEYLDNCVKAIVKYRSDMMTKPERIASSDDTDMPNKSGDMLGDNPLLGGDKNLKKEYLEERDELQKTIEQLKADNDELRKLANSNGVIKAELDEVNKERVDLQQKLANLDAELEHHKIELSKKDDLLKQTNANQASCNHQPLVDIAAPERSDTDLELQKLIASLRKELTDKEKLFRSEIRRALSVSDNRSLELADKKKEINALTGKLAQCMGDLKAQI